MAFYKITLIYQEKQYSFIDPIDYLGVDVWDSDDHVHWMYEQGNFACDCNKSIFLARYCNVDIDEIMPCGNTIALVSIEKVENT